MNEPHAMSPDTFPRSQPDWKELALGAVLFARTLPSTGAGVVPLSALPSLGLSHEILGNRLLIINAGGHGMGQSTVDRLRQHLSNAGIREVGFATTRSVSSSAPLCPSEGWAMIIEGTELSTVDELLRTAEWEAYLEAHPPPPLPEAGRASLHETSHNLWVDASRRSQDLRTTESYGAGTDVRANLQLSSTEVCVLAEFWVNHLVYLEYMWVVEGYTGSGWQDQPAARARLAELVRLGFIEQAELDAMFSRERVRAGLEPPPDQPKGAVGWGTDWTPHGGPSPAP